MIFGSICSGIEAASAAWLPLGWRCAFMSEIEAFPRAVLGHHYPETALHADFTTIRAGEYDAIDVLVGGTPCQSFSVAGLRGGLADERGNLALEYLRLAERLRPRWLVWENVPGVLSSGAGRDFGAFVGGLAELGYGWAYRVLDAQYFGLAQRRKRVFVVGHFGDWRRAAAVLFEPASLRWNPPPSRAKGQRIADSLTVGANQCSGTRSDFTEVANPLGSHKEGGWRGGDLDNDTFVAQAFDARMSDVIQYGNLSGPIDTCGHSIGVAMSLNAHGGSGRMDGESETFVAERAPALSKSNPYGDHRADGFDASEDGTGRGTPLIAFDTTHMTSPGNYSNPQPGDPCHPITATAHVPAIAGSAVRRLTPRECERLMGFSDDYTLIPYRGKPASDGPRYRALGNSMAVPVMAWIGRRIANTNARAAA